MRNVPNNKEYIPILRSLAARRTPAVGYYRSLKMQVGAMALLAAPILFILKKSRFVVFNNYFCLAKNNAHNKHSLLTVNE
jgi:hypothetical protein